MNLFKKIQEIFTPAISTEGFPMFVNPPAPAPPPPPPPKAYSHVVSMSFDGEKNLGEMGPLKLYSVDYESLRARSWQMYLDSPICQLVINRYITWVLGSGLRLQSDPMHPVLERLGININDKFNASVEDLYKVYSESTMADYAGNKSFQELARMTLLGAIVGGDMLIVSRYENGIVTNQLIDGSRISTPFSFEYQELDNGGKIKNGVELDSKGKVVAYHIRKNEREWERIPAFNSLGIRTAYLIGALDYKVDEVRHMPLLSSVLETAAKLERYQEATLGSAEEAAKVAFTIEHGATSTGENPLLSSLASVSGFGKPGDNPQTIDGEQLANKVAATVNKTVVNMPNDSKLTTHESKKELYFNDFFTANIHLVCSTIGIPPEVALMKYDSNFSASRAALKDWEHTLGVIRKKFANQYYRWNYKFWFAMEVAKGNIDAPKFIEGLTKRDPYILDSYTFARFTGTNVPHIDPLKEVEAERLKLGENGKHIPLTTVEKATETLNGGDAFLNMEEFSKELELAEKLKIEKPAPKYANQVSVQQGNKED